jgi:hypothetical protein
MKRIRFVRTALTLVCLLTPFSLGAGPDAGEYTPLPVEPRPREREPDLARENARLRAEVESLTSRVARLESRVKELEAGKPPAPKAPLRFAPPQVVPKVVPKAPGAVDPRSPTQSRPVPEGWQEREYNGMKFYIVPLRPGEAKAAAPKPAVPDPAAPKLEVDVQPAGN